MKISVGMAETINTRDDSYESLRPAIMVEDDVQPGETPHDAYNRLHKMARTLYMLQLSRLIADRDDRLSMPEPGQGVLTSLHAWVGGELKKLHTDKVVEMLLTTPQPPRE